MLARALYAFSQHRALFCLSKRRTTLVVSVRRCCASNVPISQTDSSGMVPKKSEQAIFLTRKAKDKTTTEDELQSLLQKSPLSRSNSWAEIKAVQQLLKRIIFKAKKQESAEIIQTYVMRNLHYLAPRFIPMLLYSLWTKGYITRSILSSGAVRISKILKDDPKVNFTDENLSLLFWIYGKLDHYSEYLCDTVSPLLLRDQLPLNPRMVSNLAWYNARVQYYDPAVLDKVAVYSLKNFDILNFKDVTNVVYAFGTLNHYHEELFAAVEKKLLSAKDTDGMEQLYWVYIWSSLVLDVCNPLVLNRVLKEKFMERTFGLSDSRSPHCLLQLSIAVNYEHREFNLHGDHMITSPGEIPFPSIKGVPKELIKKTLFNRVIRSEQPTMYSVFAENVQRALKQVVGEHYNMEALSICGYSIDFEILFDSDNNLIPVPRLWKMPSIKRLLANIEDKKMPESREILTNTSLIDSLKQSETTEDTMNDPAFTQSIEKSVHQQISEMPRGYVTNSNLNITSDWGVRFEQPAKPIARRVAIEADGHPHFARNCDHVMGPTVIKHRQLRALGWEVIQIPFREWQNLISGDDHVRYLKSKLYPNSHNQST